MEFLTDLWRSFYDFKGLGRELSTRSAGRVIGTLAVLSVIYGLVTGNWYASSAGELAAIVTEEAKRHLPAVVISDGTLSSGVAQPHIVTDQDLSPEFFAALDAWAARWLHVNTQGMAERLFQQWTSRAGKLFCVILDTTGTYADQIDPDAYPVAIIIDQHHMRIGTDSQEGRQLREVAFSELSANAPIGVPLALDPRQLDEAMVARRVSGSLVVWVVLVSILLSFVRFAWKALVIGALVWLISAAARSGFSFGRAYTLAVYALVPVVVLALVRLMWVPYPGVLVWIAHAVYGIAPLVYCPSQTTTSALPPHGPSRAS